MAFSDETKVKHYEALLRRMQGQIFYCEDEEGILRRWHPPRPLVSRGDKGNDT